MAWVTARSLVHRSLCAHAAPESGGTRGVRGQRVVQAWAHAERATLQQHQAVVQAALLLALFF